MQCSFESFTPAKYFRLFDCRTQLNRWDELLRQPSPPFAQALCVSSRVCCLSPSRNVSAFPSPIRGLSVCVAFSHVAFCDLRFALCDLHLPFFSVLRLAFCVLRFAFCVLRLARCVFRFSSFRFAIAPCSLWFASFCHNSQRASISKKMK